MVILIYEWKTNVPNCPQHRIRRSSQIRFEIEKYRSRIGKLHTAINKKYIYSLGSYCHLGIGI